MARSYSVKSDVEDAAAAPPAPVLLLLRWPYMPGLAGTPWAVPAPVAVPKEACRAAIPIPPEEEEERCDSKFGRVEGCEGVGASGEEEDAGERGEAAERGEERRLAEMELDVERDGTGGGASVWVK